MCNLNLHVVFTNIASCMSDQTKLVWVLELWMDSYDHTWYLGELDWFPYWILCKCDNFSCLMRNFNWTFGLLQEVQKKGPVSLQSGGFFPLTSGTSVHSHSCHRQSLHEWSSDVFSNCLYSSFLEKPYKFQFFKIHEIKEFFVNP